MCLGTDCRIRGLNGRRRVFVCQVQGGVLSEQRVVRKCKIVTVALTAEREKGEGKGSVKPARNSCWLGWVGCVVALKTTRPSVTC